MTDYTLYPAIDVREGRVVRLRQGDYAQETRYADDPLSLASRYAEAGARWLHLVDLDAAKLGGYTLAPLDLHYKSGRIKIEVGLAKGKKQHDKRDTIKEREWAREQQRLLRNRTGSVRARGTA